MALASADWKSIHVTSKHIRASYIMEKKLTEAQAKELESALPAYFKQLDAEFHQRAAKLGAAAAAHDDPESRMRLRSIDVQLGRLVEEAASGRDGLIVELREDMAALTRAIRRLERGDGA